MAFSSFFLKQGRKAISITKLFSSFSTSSSSSSSSPPCPIPNRRLRDENPSNKPPPRPQLHKFSFPLQNDPKDADFLAKLKRGSETTPDAEKNVEHEVEKVEEDVDEIFKKMKETGLIQNAVAMLDGLCKDGLVQEAMKLFGLMREKGTIPEVVIFTAVVEGFCKGGKFDDAIRIFEKMQKNSVVPNSFSYGVLVRGLCKGGRLEDAVGFCVEMLESGHSPNLGTFVGLIDGVCREKGLEDAKSLIETLKEKGFCYEEKAAREYLEKKGPFLPLVWEAIIGKEASQKSSFFS